MQDFLTTNLCEDSFRCLTVFSCWSFFLYWNVSFLIRLAEIFILIFDYFSWLSWQIYRYIYKLQQSLAKWIKHEFDDVALKLVSMKNLSCYVYAVDIMFYFLEFVIELSIWFAVSVVERFLPIFISQFKCCFRNAVINFGFIILINVDHVQLAKNAIVKAPLI